MSKISNIFEKITTAFTPPIYVAKRQKRKEDVDGRILALTDSHSYLAEQYKVLRTNLYSISPEKPIRTIALTSAQAQEGKTITSCNLAYTMSLDKEKKILLVDSDCRKPAVHKMFAIPRKPGFTDILNGKATVEEFAKKPLCNDLYIIPSGSLVANTSELLSSTKIKNVINTLKTKFDYIIFDTPPVINVTDSSILGAICDGVILVVREGMTPKNMVEEAFTMLQHAQAKPKACIVTGSAIPVYYYYLSRYRYYYKYK